MKKIIYLFLILVLASFTTSKELIPISGKITNTANGTIGIKGELFEKEIKLKADGNFSDHMMEFIPLKLVKTAYQSICQKRLI